MDRAQGLADQAAHAFEVGCAEASRKRGGETGAGRSAPDIKDGQKPPTRLRSEDFPLLSGQATWPEHGSAWFRVDPEKAISFIREPELKAIVAG
jgi:hypothetical protein